MQLEQKQNKIFFIGFALLFLLIAWSFARPYIINRSDDAMSEEEINAEILRAPLMTPKDLYEKIANGEKFVIIDLRDQDSFDKGHLESAMNLSAANIIKDKLKEIGSDKTSSVVLVNEVSDVYETANKTNMLIDAGFVNTMYLQGGIDYWKGQGYPLIASTISSQDMAKIKKIDVSGVAADLVNGKDLIQFVDVRASADFKKGHIPGALNIPLLQLETQKDKISGAKRVVVYADDEDPALRAAVTLFDLNFLNVYVLDGGFKSWKEAGAQVE